MKFIIGLDGPHVKVVAHILKKCGYFFNHNSDEQDLENYTKNDTLETFYRHLTDGSPIEQAYLNEFFGFVDVEMKDKHFWSTKEFKDINCIEHLIGSNHEVSVIYVKYDYEDINKEFLQSVNENTYNNNLSKIESFLNDVREANWPLVEIDYVQFLQDPNYRLNKLQEIVGNEIAARVMGDLGEVKVTDDPDDVEQTYFAHLVANYNDKFANGLLSDIIEQIPPTNMIKDLTLEELRDNVKKKNSKA
jgi:hypothetical protein